jgi:hypothetical protein
MWALTLPLTHAMALVRAGAIVGTTEAAGRQLLALAVTIAVALGLALPRLPVLLRDPKYWGEHE